MLLSVSGFSLFSIVGYTIFPMNIGMLFFVSWMKKRKGLFMLILVLGAPLRVSRTAPVTAAASLPSSNTLILVLCLMSPTSMFLESVILPKSALLLKMSVTFNAWKVFTRLISEPASNFGKRRCVSLLFNSPRKSNRVLLLLNIMFSIFSTSLSFDGCKISISKSSMM